MCGIAGIWGRPTSDRLRAMADRLRHRGPDGEGFWTAPNHTVGLAHRRLAVIDPEGGRQPLTNEDGRVVTVFNGEIYNYIELRAELRARGHRFATDSDTEVIVHLYEEHGPDVVDHLRGMFALAIWDESARRLVLARDRVGKKPLYYAAADDEFLFASEIKGLAAAGLSRGPTLDEQALADYLAWGAVPAPSTIYREVRAVAPAEVLVVEDRRIRSRRSYWQPQMVPKAKLDVRQAVEQVDATLQEAVRLRLRADVPVGVFLSGGIDSGLITALAAKASNRTLTTITIGFVERSFDERPLARLVAQRYHTEHHEVVVEPNVADLLPRLAVAYDQPFADSSAIPSYYVAQAARRHVKVVLNGDGGDEVFCGYRRYVAAWLSGRLRRMDGPAGRLCWRALAGLLPRARRSRSGYAFVRRLLQGLGRSPSDRYMTWASRFFTDAEVAALWAASGGDAPPASPSRLAYDLLAPLTQLGPVDQMSAADLGLFLPHDLLVKMDVASMAHGLEARSPLLDQVLIDAVTKYPERTKLHGWRTKPLLRALAARYLPAELLHQPKRGFEVPLVRWLRADLREMRDDVILARDGLPVERFGRGPLEALLRGTPRLGPLDWAQRVWALLMLGLWDRHARWTAGRHPAD